MIENFEEVVRIKLIHCPMYEEYGVVIVFEKGSKVIDCETSEEAQALYNRLTKQLKDFKESKASTLTQI